MSHGTGFGEPVSLDQARPGQLLEAVLDLCVQGPGPADTELEGDQIVVARPGMVRQRHEHRRDAGEHRSEEHTSELQSRLHLVCRLLLEKKKKNRIDMRRVYS